MDGSITTFKHKGEPNVSYYLALPVSKEEADWDNIEIRRIN